MTPAFRDDYAFLSNFYVAPFIDETGQVWMTTEHYYQGMLALDAGDRQWIAMAPTPGIAKRRARASPRTADADSRRLDVMARALRLKFAQNPHLGVALVATYPHELVEWNTWGDTFWGRTRRAGGENYLGRLLMALRDELRDRQST